MSSTSAVGRWHRRTAGVMTGGMAPPRIHRPLCGKDSTPPSAGIVLVKNCSGGMLASEDGSSRGGGNGPDGELTLVVPRICRPGSQLHVSNSPAVTYQVSPSSIFLRCRSGRLHKASTPLSKDLQRPCTPAVVVVACPSKMRLRWWQLLPRDTCIRYLLICDTAL